MNYIVNLRQKASQAWIRAFIARLWRGYSPSVSQILKLLAADADSRTTVRAAFLQGYFR
jgi:hypothetical protein